MLGFLMENMGNIIIGVLVLAIATAAVLHVRKARKSGGCGYGCDGCSSSTCPSSRKS